MLDVLEFDGHSVYDTSINNMNFHHLKWINSVNPTKEEKDLLKQYVGLSNLELEKCLDPNERPITSELEHFSLLIFKAPHKALDRIHAPSFAILISKNLIVTIQKKEVDSIKKLWSVEEDHKHKLFHKGSSAIAYELLEMVMDHYFEILDDIEKEIDIVENKVFHSTDKSSVKKIFKLKKTLIFFHKSLAGNREVLLNITNDSSEKIDDKYIPKFMYVHEDNIQLIDMTATYRDILTSALDIYLSNESNNLNNIMKRMTAFASFILIPTFITGLYGMNFKFFPELSWKYGYLFAWGLIIACIVGLYIYFKKKDWI